MLGKRLLHGPSGCFRRLVHDNSGEDDDARIFGWPQSGQTTPTMGIYERR